MPVTYEQQNGDYVVSWQPDTQFFLNITIPQIVHNVSLFAPAQPYLPFFQKCLPLFIYHNFWGTSMCPATGARLEANQVKFTDDLPASSRIFPFDFDRKINMYPNAPATSSVGLLLFSRLLTTKNET